MCLQGGVDIERIMAVWERFFENAAKASVGGANKAQDSDDPLFNNQHEEDRRYSRYCAWETTSADPLPDKMGEDFDIGHHASPSQQYTKEERPVRLETGAPFVSSDDADLHLFQTPRGCNDAEEMWLLERRPESSHSSRESPLAGENSVDLLHQQAWVPCWDAVSESIYYWNSESGELTWNTPPPANLSTEENTLDRFSSCVWDPQQEAYFVTDEDGVSRWLTEDEAASGAACTTTFSGQAASDGRRAHFMRQVALTPEQQEFEADAATLAGSPSIEKGGARDGSHVLMSENCKEVPTGKAGLPANSQPEFHSVGLSQQPLPNATRQVFNDNDNDDDDVHGFYDTEEGSYRYISDSTPRSEDEFPVAVEQPSPENIAIRSSAPATTNESPRGDNRSEDVEFFDTKTWEDHHQLSAWVLWCAQPSLDENGGTPPYFVNEETCTSSWVLPPEAVATSRGWVRAWSEEHQARFYANQWTGRVTWDIEDLEAEGWLTVRHGG